MGGAAPEPVDGADGNGGVFEDADIPDADGAESEEPIGGADRRSWLRCPKCAIEEVAHESDTHGVVSGPFCTFRERRWVCDEDEEHEFTLEELVRHWHVGGEGKGGAPRSAEGSDSRTADAEGPNGARSEAEGEAAAWWHRCIKCTRAITDAAERAKHGDLTGPFCTARQVVAHGVGGVSGGAPAQRWVCPTDEKHQFTSEELHEHWATWSVGKAGGAAWSAARCILSQPIFASICAVCGPVCGMWPPVCSGNAHDEAEGGEAQAGGSRGGGKCRQARPVRWPPHARSRTDTHRQGTHRSHRPRGAAVQAGQRARDLMWKRGQRSPY